jgi:hypothetical protein
MTTSDHVDIFWAREGDGNHSSQPLLHQHGLEIQEFGTRGRGRPPHALP